MIIENVIAAFGAVFAAKTLLLMAVGVAGGLIAGAIPGFTIAMAVVLTLPFTFSMPPEQGLSTMVSISLGITLVAGRKRVPNPATGKTALRILFTMGLPSKGHFTGNSFQRAAFVPQATSVRNM